MTTTPARNPLQARAPRREHDEPPRRRASFSRRSAAFAIDVGLLGLICVLPAVKTKGAVEDIVGTIGFVADLMTRFEVMGVSEEAVSAACSLAAAVLGPIVYFLACGVRIGGQTVGKRLCHVRLVRFDGSTPLGLGEVVARMGSVGLSAAPLGAGGLAMLWDSEGFTWHDRTTRTAVVEARWSDPCQSLFKPLLLTTITTAFFAVGLPAILLLQRTSTVLRGG